MKIKKAKKISFFFNLYCNYFRLNGDGNSENFRAKLNNFYSSPGNIPRCLLVVRCVFFIFKSKTTTDTTVISLRTRVITTYDVVSISFNGNGPTKIIITTKSLTTMDSVGVDPVAQRASDTDSLRTVGRDGGTLPNRLAVRRRPGRPRRRETQKTRAGQVGHGRKTVVGQCRPSCRHVAVPTDFVTRHRALRACVRCAAGRRESRGRGSTSNLT